MTGEAPIADECFSEAPLKPRRLSFSESTPSDVRLNEMIRAEAPTKLVAALAEVFVIMVGRRARQELRMQVTKSKVNELNGDHG